VVANALMYGGINYTFNMRQADRITLQEKTTHALYQRLQELVGDIEGIEHLERPDYLDRLSTLRTQSFWFGNVGSEPQRRGGTTEVGAGREVVGEQPMHQAAALDAVRLKSRGQVSPQATALEPGGVGSQQDEGATPPGQGGDVLQKRGELPLELPVELGQSRLGNEISVRDHAPRYDQHGQQEHPQNAPKGRTA
jgi:hypothetical protein